MKLRPYQMEAKRAIYREWDEGRKKTALILPTGCGKTVVFGSIAAEIANKGYRTLILAHRGELLDQASDKIQSISGIIPAVEKAEKTSLFSSSLITVGSVQSMARPSRLRKFPENYFKTVIVDEAHHIMSDTYQRVMEHFGDAYVLGVTATPDRADKKDLGKYFDSKAYEYNMSSAVKDGYLCPIMAQMVPIKIDATGLVESQGDYTLGSIGDTLDPYLDEIAKEMVQYCKDRKTVVFLPLISTSQKFCQLLNDYGLSAVEVNGNSADREQILKDFEEDRYQVICNSMLLTEGWDCPSVDCVVVLRPTKVRALYQQMVGRGMRLSPGKENLLLLDFLWMTEKHQLCRPSSLVCGTQEIAEKVDAAIAEGEEVDLLEENEQAERDAVEEREKSLAAALAAQSRKKKRLVDPFEYAISLQDEDLMFYEPSFLWEMEDPTDAQLSCLDKFGIDSAAIKSKGQACMIIDKLMLRTNLGYSTPKQIRCLEKYGFTHVGQWTFDQASAMISRLAGNRWMLPYGFSAETYVPA